MWIYIVCGFVIIGVSCVWLFITSKNLPKYSYSIDDWKNEEAVYYDNGFSVSEKIKNSGRLKEFLWGPYKSLHKGSYTAIITYAADEDQYCIVKGSEFVHSSKGLLSKHLNSVDYQFEISEEIDSFNLVIWYNGSGNFTVKSISIVSNNRLQKRLVTEITAFVILFGFFLYFAVNKKQQTKIILAVFGITLVAVFPLASYGLNAGFDLEAHLLRIEAILQALKSGQFPARISSVTLFGLGYPFSIYYNDLFLYFPALLRLLGFSVNSAYKVYLFSVVFLTAGIAYYSFRSIFQDIKTGLLLALLYSTASYHFTNLYVRAAVGEYTAQAFLPLLSLALYRIYQQGSERENRVIPNGLLLAISLSGIIGSHILTLIMTGFLMVFVCMILWKRTFTKRVLLTFGFGGIVTILLNLYFLVPFTDYYFNVPTVIKAVVESGRNYIQQVGIQPSQFVSFFQRVVGNWNPNPSERMQGNPGLALMIIFFVGIYERFTGLKKPSFRLILFLSAFTIFLSTDVFPWNQLSYHFRIWNFLAQIQYPVRFLIFIILFLTLLAGEIPIVCNSKVVTGAVVCAAVLISFWFTGNLLENGSYVYIYDTSGVDPYKTGFEYYLQGTDWNETYTDIVVENMTDARINLRKSNQVNLYCKSDSSEEPHRVFVPVYNYKGYHVFDESGREYAILNGDQNHLGFELPDNFDGIVTVKFQDPVLWTVSLYISVLTGIILIIFRFAAYKKEI